MNLFPTARLSNRRGLVIASLLLFGIAAWTIRHLYHLIDPAAGSNELGVIWIITFVMLSFSTILGLLEKPYKTTRRQDLRLNRLNVAVVIPAYNEEPEGLRKCIASVMRQSRPVQSIIVVDDGSHDRYDEVKAWAMGFADRIDNFQWIRTENQGKRHAQAEGIKRTADADIYLTVDSDTILEINAVREGLKPFADNRVSSSGGLVLASNQSLNWLTAITGVWDLVWQLVDRSAQSTLKSVTVNSGPIAFYRGWIIRKYLDSYLNETFFGRPVKYSDDSLLTTYCMMHGQTVQQPTSFCFSDEPVKVSHHIRRYIRWMRGSFIRSWWRVKYLGQERAIYWLHLARWFQFFLSLFVICYLVFSGMVFDPAVIPYLILVPVIIAYAQGLRYFVVSRSDQSFRLQLFHYSLIPLMLIWQYTVIRVVKWYAYATCLENKWGTRQTIEVVN